MLLHVVLSQARVLCGHAQITAKLPRPARQLAYGDVPGVAEPPTRRGQHEAAVSEAKIIDKARDVIQAGEPLLLEPVTARDAKMRAALSDDCGDIIRPKEYSLALRNAADLFDKPRAATGHVDAARAKHRERVIRQSIVAGKGQP